MQVIPSEKQVKADPFAATLIQWLDSLEGELNPDETLFYHQFPLYKDTEGNNVLADALLISPSHGVIAFAIPDHPSSVRNVMGRFEQVPAHIQSRLVRTKALRKGAFNLIVPISAAVVITSGDVSQIPALPDGFCLVDSADSLGDLLSDCKQASPMSETVYAELLATIDGAKGLVRATPRPEPTDAAHDKAKVAYVVETAINEFDLGQKHGMYGAIPGLIRLRGIAGSGKTVVLAMKAAFSHLREPTSHILYTFYTKSLYQHVRRLITRFYRQFDDKDPNWDFIHVQHAWGGRSTPGVYSETCARAGMEPLSFAAAKRGVLDPFDYACQQLEKSDRIEPVYDYVLIDEGQDFPASFTRICFRLAKGQKLVFAYDELQNIFQPTAPDVSKYFGADGAKVELADDVILHRCYRNPREVLVCAHAVGFGFYGQKIVQLLEGKDHWQDVGYDILKGDFAVGSQVVMERPASTSLDLVSRHLKKEEIVSAKSFGTASEEIAFVVESIKADLAAGLKPEDILVISVDDRNAKMYLNSVQQVLVRENVAVNNLHEDSYSSKEFWINGHVTLSTIHKAKGNEAFMVYVVGSDAPMRSADVKRRNVLFTAMTRAKAWLRVTGMGENADKLVNEINTALANCPQLVFTMPSAPEIEVIKRDVKESLDRKARVRRIVQELSDDLTEEEIAEILAERKKEMGRQRKLKTFDKEEGK